MSQSQSEMQSQVVGLLSAVIADDQLHGRWLNSLSLLENSGARKISAAQHQDLVTEQMLRHTVEEARHAWYLKRQIHKLTSVACPTFEAGYLLAPTSTRQYLQKLDVAVSRLVKSRLALDGHELRAASYLLVTYAIEVKADSLYGTYDRLLQEHDSAVSVRTILMEEENHLAEMTSAIENQFDDPQWWIAEVCQAEQQIFADWLSAVDDDVKARNLTND